MSQDKQPHSTHQADSIMLTLVPVSYTHLTLPTKLEV